ncbi:MFS transporter [bacterium]|nr:MFS transporter [bacterium]
MISRIIILSSLGYFVDILDLFLFSVVRRSSLLAIGVSENDLLSQGIFLLNMQMAGLILGSFIWGVLGDKKGRVKVLYGSILLYSLATLLNAFVTNTFQYAFLRFIAGVGLSGELGAAITLVSESMESKKRGLGTMIVAGFGLMGGMLAALLSEVFAWNVCYMIGGGIGLGLLLLRVALPEPEMFKEIAHHESKGDLRLLLKSHRRIGKLTYLVLMGLPIWFNSGILMVFAPEFGKALLILGEPITASKSVLYSYFGVALGDFVSGGLSQWTKSRKKIVLLFILLLAGSMFLYLSAHEKTQLYFYSLCFTLGFFAGYWALLVTMTAENFGTNLRATVTTVVPNLVRASVIPLSFLFEWFNRSMGVIESASYVAIIAVLTSLWATTRLPETFGVDLKFLEE